MTDQITVVDVQRWQTAVFSGWWVRLGNYRHDPRHEPDMPDLLVADFMWTADGGTDFLLVDLDRTNSPDDAPQRLVAAIDRCRFEVTQ